MVSGVHHLPATAAIDPLSVEGPELGTAGPPPHQERGKRKARLTYQGLCGTAGILPIEPFRSITRWKELDGCSPRPPFTLESRTVEFREEYQRSLSAAMGDADTVNVSSRLRGLRMMHRVAYSADHVIDSDSLYLSAAGRMSGTLSTLAGSLADAKPYLATQK
jgi:hypothetical protein